MRFFIEYLILDISEHYAKNCTEKFALVPELQHFISVSVFDTYNKGTNIKSNFLKMALFSPCAFDLVKFHWVLEFIMIYTLKPEKLKY